MMELHSVHKVTELKEERVEKEKMGSERDIKLMNQTTLHSFPFCPNVSTDFISIRPTDRPYHDGKGMEARGRGVLLEE